VCTFLNLDQAISAARLHLGDERYRHLFIVLPHDSDKEHLGNEPPKALVFDRKRTWSVGRKRQI
jgi:hypothetical protein